MMDRIDPKVLIGGILGLVLVGLLSYYLFVIRPVDEEAKRLTIQLEQALRDRDSYQTQLNDKKSRLTTVSDEIQRLKLFDLRAETAFDAALANRSNLGLIALSEILQRNAITIESLTPGPIDQNPITIQQQPSGGVLHRRYLIKAQGRYQDVQTAFSAFKDLPPALDIDYYDIQYVGADGNRARVYFEIGFGFNFLVTNEQFTLFAEMASASLAAASASFTFPGEASGTIGAPALPPALNQAPPASNQVAPPIMPQATPASPQSEVSRLRWHALVDWLDPAAHAGPLQVAQAPGAKPSPKPGQVLKAYTFSVDKGVSLGRAEPFLPLGPAREAPVKLGKPISPVKPVAAPLPEAAVLAVLLSNDGPATALLQYGNERMRVRPGSLLTGGAQVAAIGRDFVLIRYQGTLHRIGLQTDSMSHFNPPSMPAQAAPTSMATPRPLPVPDVPRVPTVQGP